MPVSRWIIIVFGFLAALAQVSTRILKRMGLFYASALGIAVVMLYGFLKLGNEVMEGELTLVNTRIHDLMRLLASPFLNQFAKTITLFGNWQVVLAIAMLVSIYYLIQRRYRDCLILGILLAGGFFMIYGLKAFYHLPRPLNSMVVEPGYTFPSGHSLISISFYGYLALTLLFYPPFKRKHFLAALLLLVLSGGVMWSRLYLGVHWFSDVLAGALIGSFWAICCFMLNRYDKTRNKRLKDIF